MAHVLVTHHALRRLGLGFKITTRINSEAVLIYQHETQKFQNKSLIVVGGQSQEEEEADVDSAASQWP